MIKKVRIVGKQRPITFSMATLIEFSEVTGREVASIFSGEPPLKVTEVYRLMYLALKSGADDSGVLFDLSFGDFTNKIYTDLEGFQAAWNVLQNLIEAMVESYASEEEDETEVIESATEKKIAE